MMANDLKKFEGSREESVLQEFLNSSRIKTDFLNLVIKSCNVLKPVSFTNADVVLDLMNRCDKEIARAVPRGSGLTAVKIRFEKVFNMELIEKLSTCGVADLQDEVITPVLTIMNYLQNIEHHQNAIYSVKKRGGNEAEISAVMAQHLFCQLIPGNKYCLDNRSKHLPKVCPCQLPNCGKEIQAGCTSLGSGDTWHGFVDILLNNNVAVSVIDDDEEDNRGPSAVSVINDDEEDSDKGNPGPSAVSVINDDEEDSDEDNRGPSAVSVINDDEEDSDDNNSGPSAPKQWCRSSRKGYLLKMNVIDQIIAETITNAFAQINLTKALTGWLIPTLGCTVDQVVVFMYDPINDVLLQSMDLNSCWVAEKTLDLTTVIFIWMLLNFPIFMCKNLADQYEFDRSNFHTLAEEKLTMYQRLVSGNNESFDFENDTYAKVVMPKIHYIAKDVQQRK